MLALTVIDGLSALDSLEDSFIRWVSGEYREAVRIALEVRAKGLELEANPNLKIEYVRAASLVPLNLHWLTTELAS
jgi:hypothetical protein